MVAGQGGSFVGGGEERIWSSIVLGGIDEYRKEIELNPNSEIVKEPLVNFLRKQIKAEKETNSN